jgi:glycosyltransferase involved in cell wall biosynthesis
MSTKVLDIDMENIPESITGLDGYQRLMVLVRINGRPVERLYLRVSGVDIPGSELRSAILQNAGWTFWEFWLRKILSCPVDENRTDQLPGVTIAICTRDRPDDLRRCLETFVRIAHDQEILVVDSCSTGQETGEVVQKFPAVHYVREDKPGLDRARNRALKEASNEIVAFIDDDATPSRDWVVALTRNFSNPIVGCVTGLTMPIELETKAQECFEEYCTFSRGFQYKVYDWSTLHPLSAGRAGVGTNMALRRSALAQVGEFDEALDAGTPTFSGGETDMFSRLLAAGYQIVYEPRALNWHRHRRSWDELRRTIYGYGVGTYSFWTRKFLVDREWWVVWLALRWFLTGQIPMLFRSLLRLQGAPAIDLICLELIGCLVGPMAYIKSRSAQST